MASYQRHVPIFLLSGSFVIGFILMVVMLPEWLRLVRPDFIALLLIYWLMRIPESIGVGFAWLVGFLFDGISGSLLGMHALACSFLAYLVLVLYQRIRMFGMVQQALLVFILLAVDQLVNSWVDTVLYQHNFNIYCLLSALTGACCWPIVNKQMNYYQRYFVSMA